MFREFSRVALQKSRKGHRQCESCNNQQSYHLKKRSAVAQNLKILTAFLESWGGQLTNKCWGMSTHPQLVPGLTASSAAGRLPLARISGMTGADGAAGAAGADGADGWSFTFLDPGTS